MKKETLEIPCLRIKRNHLHPVEYERCWSCRRKVYVTPANRYLFEEAEAARLVCEVCNGRSASTGRPGLEPLRHPGGSAASDPERLTDKS